VDLTAEFDGHFPDKNDSHSRLCRACSTASSIAASISSSGTSLTFSARRSRNVSSCWAIVAFRIEMFCMTADFGCFYRFFGLHVKYVDAGTFQLAIRESSGGGRESRRCRFETAPLTRMTLASGIPSNASIDRRPLQSPHFLSLRSPHNGASTLQLYCSGAARIH
jgi:hypothetical protein